MSLLARDCGLHFPLLHHKEVCSRFTSLLSFQASSQDHRSCPEVTHSVRYLSVNLNVIIFSLLQLRKIAMHKGLTDTFRYHRKRASPSSAQIASHGGERHCKRGVLGENVHFTGMFQVYEFINMCRRSAVTLILNSAVTFVSQMYRTHSHVWATQSGWLGSISTHFSH